MNAVLAVTYADVPGFPAGSAVAAVVATVVGSSGPPLTQSVPPGSPQIVFSNIPADTYSLTVAAQDAAGNTFGTPVTGSFTITAPSTVTLSLPSAVSTSQT